MIFTVDIQIQQVLDFRDLDNCNPYNTRIRRGWNEPENTEPQTSQTKKYRTSNFPNLKKTKPRSFRTSQCTKVSVKI